MKKNSGLIAQSIVLCAALCASLVALCCAAEAQQPKNIIRIGYVVAADPATDSARSEAVRVALRELGYVEGQNVVSHY